MSNTIFLCVADDTEFVVLLTRNEKNDGQLAFVKADSIVYFDFDDKPRTVQFISYGLIMAYVLKPQNTFIENLSSVCRYSQFATGFIESWTVSDAGRSI